MTVETWGDYSDDLEDEDELLPLEEEFDDRGIYLNWINYYKKNSNLNPQIYNYIVENEPKNKTITHLKGN
jgi:hypothetical protein